MMRRLRARPSVWFVVAAVLGILAAITTIRAAASEDTTVEVLVAAADLQAGTRIGEDAIAAVRVPARGVLPGLYRSRDAVLGRVVSAPIARGEALTPSGLGGSLGVGPEPLAVGERAVSVPISAAGAAAAVLSPGVLVDVVATRGDGAPEASVVVAAAEVLAVTAAAGADDAAGSEGGAVLLRARGRAALRLSAALDLGRGVRLLPRPAAEAP